MLNTFRTKEYATIKTNTVELSAQTGNNLQYLFNAKSKGQNRVLPNKKVVVEHTQWSWITNTLMFINSTIYAAGDYFKAA